MSIENAKACFIKIQTDKSFENQIKQAETRAQREKIIKNAGFEFTDEEWETGAQEVRNALNSEENTELSDEMLEAIIGGKDPKSNQPMMAYDVSPVHGIN